MPTPRNITGKKVAALRARLGLSQGGLAAKLQRAGWDVSRDVVIRIENHRRQVSDFEIAILAQVLGVDAADFFVEKLPKAALLRIAAGMKKARPGRKPAPQ